eukprot:TRINITY_DN4692_c0_g2_i1.p1 TRINITY_DN4692_c0_g2~~TRINITY_DN4692_c0_g2_i1.p1  ORF type:complete len:658 (+),score=145.22 TRINITY_DN4692_c0_g2_i1:157-2130(+)
MSSTNNNTTIPSSSSSSSSSPIPPRYQHLRNTLGDDLFKKIHESRILVVGAGGIGCELLKNLVKSGFENIEVIDLDTIDVSNLNRQFLFRREHVGHPKALVAAEAVMKFNPHAKIIAHHDNIKHSKFGIQFFSKFTMVMNALDNLDARRHVNRLCLATDIPLIESGTAGYLGQVQVIRKEKTECFECQPRPTPKQHAVCTIRSNPSAPIHCIVWAKHLYALLFGQKNDSNAVTDLNDDNNNNSNNENNNGNNNNSSETSTSFDLHQKKRGFEYWIFHKVFNLDIAKIASMKDMWKEKKPPSPLIVDDILSENSTQSTPTESTAGLKDQVVLTLQQNAEIFLSTTAQLQKRFQEIGETSWDKDDPLALSFVTSASNLRSKIFGIPLQSQFDVKSLAGNIIPAIATTNAVIAGLILTEAFKLLKNNLSTESSRSVYLYKQPSNKKLLLPAAVENPNPNCYVCGSRFLQLKANLTQITLQFLVDEVLRKSIGMVNPMVMRGGDLLIETGDDIDETEQERYEIMGKKTLEQAKILNGTVIQVEDYSQDLTLQVSIVHEEITEEGKLFELVGNSHEMKETKHTSPTTQQSQTTPTNDNNNNSNKANNVLILDDDIEIMDAPPILEPEPQKRKRSPDTKKNGKDETKKKKTSALSVSDYRVVP